MSTRRAGDKRGSLHIYQKGKRAYKLFYSGRTEPTAPCQVREREVYQYHTHSLTFTPARTHARQTAAQADNSELCASPVHR